MWACGLARLLHEHRGARIAITFVQHDNPEVQVVENGVLAVRDGDARDELLTRGVVDVIVRADVEKRLLRSDVIRRLVLDRLDLIADAEDQELVL